MSSTELPRPHWGQCPSARGGPTRLCPWGAGPRHGLRLLFRGPGAAARKPGCRPGRLWLPAGTWFTGRLLPGPRCSRTGALSPLPSRDCLAAAPKPNSDPPFVRPRAAYASQAAVRRPPARTHACYFPLEAPHRDHSLACPADRGQVPPHTAEVSTVTVAACWALCAGGGGRGGSRPPAPDITCQLLPPGRDVADVFAPVPRVCPLSLRKGNTTRTPSWCGQLF